MFNKSSKQVFYGNNNVESSIDLEKSSQEAFKKSLNSHEGNIMAKKTTISTGIIEIDNNKIKREEACLNISTGYSKKVVIPDSQLVIKSKLDLVMKKFLIGYYIKIEKQYSEMAASPNTLNESIETSAGQKIYRVKKQKRQENSAEITASRSQIIEQDNKMLTYTLLTLTFFIGAAFLIKRYGLYSKINSSKRKK